MKIKRVVILSDLHCGHRVGLTPPSFQWPIGSEVSHEWNKFGKIQRECWEWFKREIKAMQPIDIAIVNGDTIDGRGERSGGTELITGDRGRQVEIAVDCLKIINPGRFVIVRGTPYHVGEQESWEDQVSSQLSEAFDCKIGDHEWVAVEFGKETAMFDVKHYVGSSQVPYSRGTAVKRDEMWNLLWAEAKYQPRSNWIIRSHVHYYESHTRYAGDKRISCITTPALQAMGTRIGARRYSGLVDYGFLHWDFYGDGTWEYIEHILAVESQKVSPLKF